VLQARGSWRGNLREAEPQPLDERPVRPAWLPDCARPFWNEVCRQLDGMGLLKAADRNALARYCLLCAKLADMGRGGKSDPYVILAICNNLLALERQFGLTPSARAGMVHTAAPRANATGKVFKLNG
jgi:phage terminase small subunit